MVDLGEALREFLLGLLDVGLVFGTGAAKVDRRAIASRAFPILAFLLCGGDPGKRRLRHPLRRCPLRITGGDGVVAVLLGLLGAGALRIPIGEQFLEDARHARDFRLHLVGRPGDDARQEDAGPVRGELVVGDPGRLVRREWVHRPRHIISLVQDDKARR